MTKPAILGWDIGGAHLKAVLLQDGRALQVIQQACPLWRGIEQLEQAVAAVMARFADRPLIHAVTMTGELADIFPSRAVGVRQIDSCMRKLLPGAPLAVYGGPLGMLHATPREEQLACIASANWHASAAFLAAQCGNGLFVDIGSTTTDIIPLQDGLPSHAGYSDGERLATQEMVYTGVVRTPVMAVAQRAPFAGVWQGLAAEYFATMADVYRLTGELPAAYDMADTADGADKTFNASARRLARMTGRDFEDAPVDAWAQLAEFLKAEQLAMLESALRRVLSNSRLQGDAPLIAAGAGRFLVHSLAARLGRRCVDAQDLVKAEAGNEQWAAVCLPAYAVAWLLERERSC